MKAEELLRQLEGVRCSGDAWMARCPAHDDRIPSLSVAEGVDGRVLLKCFSGCGVDAIVSALGLTLRDLFSQNSRPVAAQDREALPVAEWATIRRELREERRTLADLEEEIADAIRHDHQRALAIRQAVTALGRTDAEALDLLALAANLSRAAEIAEAALDERRADAQWRAWHSCRDRGAGDA